MQVTALQYGSEYFSFHSEIEFSMSRQLILQMYMKHMKIFPYSVLSLLWFLFTPKKKSHLLRKVYDCKTKSIILFSYIFWICHAYMLKFTCLLLSHWWL